MGLDLGRCHVTRIVDPARADLLEVMAEMFASMAATWVGAYFRDQRFETSTTAGGQTLLDLSFDVVSP